MEINRSALPAAETLKFGKKVIRFSVFFDIGPNNSIELYLRLGKKTSKMSDHWLVVNLLPPWLGLAGSVERSVKQLAWSV